MSKKSLKKNYIFSLMYEILAIIVPFVTTPYVSRVLGATSIGDYYYIGGIVSYFGLIAATGTATYGNREIAILHNDKKARSKLFFEIFFFRIICTLIAFIGYSYLLISSTGVYHTLYFINILLFISWILDVSWFCQGMENFKVTAIRNSMVKIAGALLVFVFVKSSDDVWIYTLIYSGSMAIGNATMWVYVLKEVKWQGFNDLNIFGHTKSIMQLFIPVIAIQIYTVMDKTMLGYLDNTTEVGYYSQGNKIITIAMTFVNAFIAILMPRISTLYAQSEKLQLNKLIDKTLRYIFLLSIPMMVGCILIIDQFVPIFFGVGYEPVGNVIKILSLLFVMLNLGRLFGTMLVAMKRQNEYTIVTIIAAVINLVLNLVFLKIFGMGAFGVAIASVVSESVATIIQYIFVRKDIDISLILRSAISYIIPSIFMMISIYICKIFVGSGGVISLLVQLIVGISVYIVILVIRKDDMVNMLLESILIKFNIKKK